MTSAIVILLLVTIQRFSELVIARRNTAALLAKGAMEHGASHYPVMVALHGTWLIGLWWWGWDNAPLWPLVALYGFLQIFRFWILQTLGRRWTTRILTVPGEQLVAKGPYRFIRHPNYVLVALEMPLLPLALGLPVLAMVYGIANLAMLAWRISIEEKALRG
jgi:methyltransferase